MQILPSFHKATRQVYNLFQDLWNGFKIFNQMLNVERNRFWKNFEPRKLCQNEEKMQPTESFKGGFTYMLLFLQFFLNVENLSNWMKKPGYGTFKREIFLRAPFLGFKGVF